MTHKLPRVSAWCVCFFVCLFFPWRRGCGFTVVVVAAAKITAGEVTAMAVTAANVTTAAVTAAAVTVAEVAGQLPRWTLPR